MGSRAPLTPKTRHLFLRIIAAVLQSPNPMTVDDLGVALTTSPDVIAHCIGLHLFLEQKRAGELTLPPPVDYWVPKATDVITKEMLQPRQAGRMVAVEAALRSAMEIDGPDNRSRQS
jgi:hypothetical protein